MCVQAHKANKTQQKGQRFRKSKLDCISKGKIYGKRINQAKMWIVHYCSDKKDIYIFSYSSNEIKTKSKDNFLGKRKEKKA